MTTTTLPGRSIFGRDRAWLRALTRTAPIVANPGRVLADVIDEQAGRHGEAPALLSERECLTYRALADRSNRCSRWALAHGVAKGDVVGLLMPNRPEYLALWLGITRVGGVVALLNTNLTGRALAHAIDIVGPKHVIVAAGRLDAVATARPYLAGAPTLWRHGPGADEFADVAAEIDRQDGGPLARGERRPVTIEDRALHIYTSGTTGLPKAVNVSHFRVMQWSHWFAGLLDTGAHDRMYNCLPMYHSVGGVLAIGAVLVGGGSVVLRERFSAGRFWRDVRRWDCTLFQYIGELCRYLLHAPESPDETGHRLRIACGNGLRGDVWPRFQQRFAIPRILEFYAATEGNVSLFNVEGKPGAVGRIPPFLAHRFPAALVRLGADGVTPVRDATGVCTRCGPGEVGEAIGKVVDARAVGGNRFEGYTSAEASDQKILRDVFAPGDAWYRTGDLMRRDDEGYYYFVDRLGDTFRWKGENVSTAEVEAAIGRFAGIVDAAVYGVAVPRTEGRAGMASVVADGPLDLVAFRAHLVEHVPSYARPLFVRVRSALAVTATFKHSKAELAREGYDPATTSDVIYVDDPRRQAFVRLDAALYDSIQTGEVTP